MSLAEVLPILPDRASDHGNAKPYSVSELAFALKRTLEDAYGYVRLRGEVSKVTRHGSGHVYLTLKDERACIDGVIWKTSVRGLKAQPEMGLEVIVTGRITTYPSGSRYQIVIETLEPAGVGALLAQQGLIGLGSGRIAANQPMAADAPDIARPGNGRTGCHLHHGIRRVVVAVRGQLADQQVDFRQLEAGQGNIEINIEIG